MAQIHAADAKPLAVRLFEFLDKNGDGNLDAAETAKAPVTIRRWLKDHGFSPSEPVPRAKFLGIVPRMMADLRKPRPTANESNGTDTGQKTGSPKPALYASGKPPAEVDTARNPSQRLPLDYRDADTNKDGQIDFAEWRRFRDGQITKFRALDKNGDSVLSPQELGAPPSAVASNQPAKKEARKEAGASTVKFEDLSDEQKAKYRELVKTRYFDYLDANKDGKLQEKEWDVSERIKPVFVDAKIDIKNDMSAADFVNHYSKLVGTKDKAWQKIAPKSVAGDNSSGSSSDKTEKKVENTDGGPTMVTESTPYDKLPDAYREEYRKVVLKVFFDYLDESGDGKLQEKEWERSSRIKPIFVDAKIDISRDMSRSDFEKQYIQLVGTKDKTWRKHLEELRKKRR